MTTSEQTQLNEPTGAPLTAEPLYGRAMSAISWRFLSESSRFILQLTVMVILARLIRVDQFGLLALAMVVWSAFSYWSEYSENAARRARDLLAPPLGAGCTITLDTGEYQQFTGKIIEQSDRWIVLQQAGEANAPNPRPNVWITRERVLTIEVMP